MNRQCPGDGQQWRVLDTSQAAQLRNSFGEFTIRTMSLVGPSSMMQSVVVVSVGELIDGSLVRLNSGCLTGETFGDVGCDCGWQLAATFEVIAREKQGVIVYAPFEEGRGAGLTQKINSIALMQTRGMTSSEAFRALGLEVDFRDYGYAPVVLRALGLKSIRCLTNNPRKIEALEAGGIRVSVRLPLVARGRTDLRNFFADKVAAQGHQISMRSFLAKGERVEVSDAE